MLFYCGNCKRIFKDNEKCSYCGSLKIFDLREGTPCNVIGSKLKGKIIKIKDENIRLLIHDENNETYIKEYKGEQLKKVI